MVDVNYLAVLAAGISNMILGFLWYGPVFGKQWMALSGRTPQSIEGQKGKGMGKSYTLAFVGALLMAYVMSHALIFASEYLGEEGLTAGLMTGFWNWLGFIAPVTLGTVLWDGKPWKLWILTNSYYLLSLLVMGVILALWK